MSRFLSQAIGLMLLIAGLVVIGLYLFDRVDSSMLVLGLLLCTLAAIFSQRLRQK